MTTVKPCPHCGGEEVTVVDGSTFRWCVAQCQTCGAQAGEVRKVSMASIHGDDMRNAIAEWNRRTPVPPAAVAAVPEVQRSCATCKHAAVDEESYPCRDCTMMARWSAATPAPVAPTDRAAAVEQAAALAEKVSGVDTANTIRHSGVVLHDRCQCIHCMRLD